MYPDQKTQQKEAAKARARAKKMDQKIRPFPEGGTGHQKAAHEAGGVLVGVGLKAPVGLNGGCGTPTHVVGTNGGMIPCGSVLHVFGKAEPYFCGHCS